MKLKQILLCAMACVMVFSALPVCAAEAADEENMRISVNADEDSHFVIEDDAGNRFVFQDWEVKENDLGLSVVYIDYSEAPSSVIISPTDNTVVIYGKLDSYTFTSINDSLIFSIRHSSDQAKITIFPDKSFRIFAENGEISAYEITDTWIGYYSGMTNSGISLLLKPYDNSALVITPLRDNSFTIEGAEECLLSRDGLHVRFVYNQTVMDDGTILVQVEDTWMLPFTDVTYEEWFFKAIKNMYDRGLMNGTSDTTFSPNDPITRGMLVTVLYNYEKYIAYVHPIIATRHSFDDVSSDAYYDEAISWALARGIITGYSDTIFAPDDNITREQLATILIRCYKGMPFDIDATEITSTFLDFEQVSEYARESMAACVFYGVISGRTQNTLEPQGTASRAEVATVMSRIVGYPQ